MSAREQYAQGRIDETELERQLEREALLEVGRQHPVPEGWQALPPCDHDWLEITSMGSHLHQQICARCGDQRTTA